MRPHDAHPSPLNSSPRRFLGTGLAPYWRRPCPVVSEWTALMASFSTIAVETLAGGATGALCGFPSSTADQLQMSERSRAGHARWARYVQALVADYQEQDWSANCGAGIERLTLFIGRGRRGSGPFSRIPHRLGFLLPSRRPVRCPSRCIGHNLRARAVTGCASLFHSVRSAGCTRPRAQSLAHKQVIQAVAYGPHLSRLSSSVSLRPDQYGRSEKAWRYLISVMRCPT